MKNQLNLAIVWGPHIAWMDVWWDDRNHQSMSDVRMGQPARWGSCQLWGQKASNNYSHRIHGAGIWIPNHSQIININQYYYIYITIKSHKTTIFQLVFLWLNLNDWAYIPAPWILWDWTAKMQMCPRPPVMVCWFSFTPWIIGFYREIIPKWP